MTSGQIVGKMDTQKQLNVPLYIMLVLAPTRELAVQIQEESDKSGVAFCRKIGFVVENFH